MVEIILAAKLTDIFKPKFNFVRKAFYIYHPNYISSDYKYKNIYNEIKDLIDK